MNFRWMTLAAFVGWITIDVYMSGVYVVHGVSPIKLFQWDASNALGNSAYFGGLPVALLGLAMDYVVSFAWAALCLAIMNRSPAAARHPILFGTLFGALVMGIMLYAIVPLGHAKQAPFSLVNFVTVLVGHTAFFGIPVAWTLAFQKRTALGVTPSTRRMQRAM
jgi:hypothetical protein